MEINLRSDHRINGRLYPRGLNHIENEDLARALLSSDSKATPEENFTITLPRTADPVVLPDFIKVPTSGADPDVKK